MSIKKPSAVESPYVTIDTTPTRLASGPVAGGGVNTVASTVTPTVSANANANANANTASSSTGSNVSYYTSGIEGVAGLANYGRVFAGANVYVTLEQPQYVTYNQTFTGSNVGNSISVTGNITSGEYFIGDGSQLTNIAVETGTKILNGNSYANIASANGSLVIGINGGNTWTFNSQSILTAPGGSQWQNAANSDAYFTSSLDGYVHLQSLFADGNIGSEVFLEHGLMQITAHSVGANTDYVWTFDNSANLGLPFGSNISDANGTLVIEANAGSSLTLRTSNSNAYAIAYQSSNSWEAYAEDDNTGAHGAYAWIKADLITANTPRVFITNAKGSDGVELTWTFGADGSTIFPTLTVDLHNGGNQSGQTLQFGDPDQQAFITGPAPAANVAAQRLIIQGQRGNGTGEGGDVYVWGGDSEINGGDIKIYAGDADNGASGQGGNIHISGGSGQNPGGEISLTGGQTYDGQGAPVVVTGGGGSTTGGNVDLRGGGGDITGGPISIVAGYGLTTGGNVDITGGQSGAGLPGYGNVNINAGASSWHFDNTGNLTIPGNILGSGNILIVPDSASSSSYLDIYLTGGPDIHIASNDNSIVIGRDTGANIFVGNDGEVSIRTDNGATAQVWNFDDTGNLTLPGNIIAINYANGNRVTGNVTFRDEIVIGTGTSNLVSGLYLAPSSSSADANMYLRVRGNINDEPTHIHFDTGNNQYYNQFIGDDNKYIQLANTGNIVINSNDAVGNSAQWTFGTDGVATLPGEGILQSINDTVTLRSLNTTTGNANSVYLGTSGGLGFNDQAIGGNWLEIFRNGAEPEIRVPVGRGNLNIQTAQGNTAYNWTFDNTSNLTVPGDILGANVIAANTFSAAGVVKTGVFVTGNIPSAATAGAGARALVTDADTITFANLYVGSSSNTVPVWSNGTNWHIG